MVLSVCLFTRLGAWQWQRSIEKEKILRLEKTASHDFLALSKSLTVKPYQRLKISGDFDDARSFLLDNRFYQHQVGFDVLTVLKTKEGKHLLVDLGWTPAGKTRKVTPKLSLKKMSGLFKGTAYFPSSKSWVLSSAIDNLGKWPLIIEKVDFLALERLLKVDLYPFVLRLERQDPNALVRDWRVVTMKPAQHKGYAFQWFAFAFAAFVIFMVLNVERRINVSK